MKYNLILILGFFHPTLINSNNFGKTSNVSILKWKTTTKLHCKSFKCPPVEDPLCVRMRTKKIGSKTKDIYVVLLNKCELEYMKCHQGYHADVVPIKKCGHHGKLRSKRNVRQDSRKPIERDSPILAEDETDSVEEDRLVNDDYVNTKIIQSEIDKGSESAMEDDTQEMKLKKHHYKKVKIYEIDGGSDVKQDQGDKQTKVEVVFVNKQSEYEKGTDDENSEMAEDNDDKLSEVKNDKDNTESFVEENKNEKQININSDDIQSNVKQDTGDKQIEMEKGNDDNHSFINEDKNDELTVNESNKSGDQNYIKDEKKDEYGSVHDSQQATDVSPDNADHDIQKLESEKRHPKFEFPVDYDLKLANEGVDFEEYKKDCPSICPAREVMICARCRDGIYRTFLSVCHLRMFNCAHPDEKAELVSRYPCVLSAPYLAEAPSPKGRVSEPGDVDQVLRFIRCRQKEELGRGDAKCNFDTEKAPKHK